MDSHQGMINGLDQPWVCDKCHGNQIQTKPKFHGMSGHGNPWRICHARRNKNSAADRRGDGGKKHKPEYKQMGINIGQLQFLKGRSCNC